MDVYGIKTCDTCRKVKKQLDGANVLYSFHDLRDEPPTAQQVGKWAKAVGTETLLNKSSTTWRNLPETAKRDLTEKVAVRLMTENPTLMKRPIIVNGPTEVYVGWSKSVQDEVL